MVERDISYPANISLKKSLLDIIDKEKVGKQYKNRSQYISTLVEKDLYLGKLDHFSQITGFILLPVISTFFFMILAVLSNGFIFWAFSAFFAMATIILAYIYMIKQRPPKNNEE